MTDAGEAAALAAWLARLERRDPLKIEPGLERIGAVLDRMALRPPPFRVLTVGGTNGKGSVVSYLAAFLDGANLGPVGAYTSPHLGAYGERIAVAGRAVAPGPLVRALDEVDRAGAGVPLTYFEFGTAAALTAFRSAAIAVAVLEVGLGGRLDAVNALEPEAAAVVSVGLDHQEWLGPDRDRIGREKAGIFRRGRPAIVGDRDPPAGLIAAAGEIGADLVRIGTDFDVVADAGGWRYRGRGGERGPLPEPPIPGSRQRDNAAVALALLEAYTGGRLPDTAVLGQSLRRVRLPGRIDLRRGEFEWVLDVAHNPDAARVLGDWLANAPRRRTLAVCGMLADKDARAVANALAAHVERWFLGGLGGRRGLDAPGLAARMGEVIQEPLLCENIADAIAAAADAGRPGDRILVFGSFHTVGEALATGRIPPEGN